MPDGLALVLKVDHISPALSRLASEELRHRMVQGMATVVESMAVRAFDEPGLRPQAWPARKKSKATHPLLIKSGNLRQGIFSKVEGDHAKIGSPAAYAARHQLGSRDGSTPPRPFFPFLEDQLTGNAREEIDEVIETLVGKKVLPGGVCSSLLG